MSSAPLPFGDITLVFTDIEGSTRGWETHPQHYQAVLDRHDALVRSAIAAWSGCEVKTTGDGFLIAFTDPVSAVLCALDIQRHIESETFHPVGKLRIRAGLHGDHLAPRGGDYYGPSVNRAARIMSAAHGGMILLSEELARRIENSLPPEAQLIDLGSHRLKDLGAPQRLFHLTHPDLPPRVYPPLRTLEALPHNFPAQVTSFVGRERELKELGDLIYLQRARLLTLLGPGGTGKTRLALQLAAEHLQHYPDGVWLVELAHVTDAREVPTAFALALSVPTENAADARANVFAFLRERRALLVLDNFEQVIDSARFVSDLLRECPNIVCLVTSRQLLQVSGEYEYPVSPLALPPSDVGVETCLDYESMRLFLERSQSARPGFALTEETVPAVAAICRRLEGLPLAVELTATLVRGMTPQQILPRLDNRFRLLETSRRDLEPRQRSLRGAIDWSYDLMSEEERALFAELSVFAGGFFLEDAEAVCSAPDTLMRVLDLRDKSLLKSDTALDATRCAMLDTLREYAQEKLEKQGDFEALRQRHATHFLSKAESLADALTEGDPIEASARMTVDIDNMRAGMVWAEAHQEATLIAGYSTALSRYFQRRGLYEDAERWLALAEEGERKLAAQEEIGSASREDSHTRRLAHILLQRGLLHYRRAEYPAAVAYFEECLPLFRQGSDWRRVVSSLTNLGNSAWATNNYDKAQAHWEEALELARQQNLPRDEGDLLSALAILAYQHGNEAQARHYSEQGIALLRRTGDTEGLAYATLNYGDLLLTFYENLPEPREKPQAERLLLRAQQQLEESHRLFLAMEHSEGIAQTTERRGLLALLQGDLREAEEHCLHSLNLSEQNNDRRCQLCAHRDLGRIALSRVSAPQDALGLESDVFPWNTAVERFRAALSLAEELQDAAEVACVLHRIGEMAEKRGCAEQALLAYRVAMRSYDELETDCSPALQEADARARAALSATVRQKVEEQAHRKSARAAAEDVFARVLA